MSSKNTEMKSLLEICLQYMTSEKKFTEILNGVEKKLTTLYK